MKKFLFHSGVFSRAITKQRLLLMFKWAFFFIFALCLKVSAKGYSQDNKISLDIKNMEFRKVLTLLQKKGRIHLLYSNEMLPVGKEISLTARDEGVLEVLQKVLVNTDLQYQVLNEELVVLTLRGAELRNVPVKGRITDEKGQPLHGVTVAVEGAKTAVTTNANGEFEISVPENGSLVFSYVGYIRQRISVGQRSSLDIVLVVDPVSSSLNDVIVVGYGTQKRSDVTGSVASIPKSRLSELPVTNVMNAVEGSVAGFTVTQTSSAPGTTATLQVRGLNSINASTSPLIVLDGVPFPGSTNDINANDIESIEVLKDASATAIYGTRGSSGVLLITTKRGRTGKPVIRYNAYAGPEYFAHTLKPMDGAQYVEKNIVDNQQRGTTPPQPVYDSVLNLAEVPNFRAGHQTDWIKEVSRAGASIQSHNLNVSGGTNDVRYYINGEYTKDNGILKGYQYRRVSLRSNLDANLTPWLTIGTTLFYANNNYDGGHVNLTLAGQMSPYGQEYNANGTYDVYPMYTQLLYMNPLLGLYEPVINRSNNLTGTGYLDLKPAMIKGLKYRLNASYSYLPGRYDYYTGRNMGDLIGHAYAQNTETQNWILENILSYARDFNQHHIDLTALYSAQHNSFFVTSLAANTFINDQLGFNDINAGQVQSAGNADALNNNAAPSQYALLSQMGRLNYSYAGKYLLTLTARRDGYSGFGALTSKYGTFPSVAVAWNIAKEDFMKNVSFVNALKLRASYGTTGNSAIGPYQTLTTLGVTQYVYNGTTATGTVVSNQLAGTQLGSLGNAGLKWESTTGTNIGIDFGLFNRVDGTVEGYLTKTSDLLLARNLPVITGYSSILDNIGKLQNTGMDINIHSINIRTRDFTWETNLVYSFFHNKITQLYGDGKDDIGNSWFIGKSLGAIYTYKLLGVWQTGQDPSGSNPGAKPGDLKFADLDKSGSITAADRTIVGYTVPKWTGGIINTFTYRNFSLRVFISTTQGAMKNNPILNPADQAGAINLPASVGYWTAANQSNTRSSLSYTNPLGYAFPSKDGYTRIRDVTLNYHVPARIVNSWGLGALSCYLSGRNLHTFTKWIGWDPETNYNGGTSVNYDNYPQVASYVFGVNVSLK
jgi:TonB-linked SusC/RagA family outer membrane protein